MPELLTQPNNAQSLMMVAGMKSECRPASNRNGGRLHVGIGGRHQSESADNHKGLATYRLLGHDAELITLDATPANHGTGTAIIDALVAQLQTEGCKRLWLTTTNDNLSALRFYMRRDFRLMQVRPGAVDAARKLKPTIPLIGKCGIPMREEIDLCRVLDLGAAIVETLPVPPPWGRVA